MPGVNEKISNAPTARFSPTATGKWFCAQLLERGSTAKAILVTSMQQFKELVGSRVAYSVMWDAAQTFFEEGGSELFLARVVGATPVSASLVLKSTAEESLIVKAANPGEWGNTLEMTVAIVGGEEYTLTLSEGGVEIAKSPTLKTQLAAVAWAAEVVPSYITIAVGSGTKSPTVLAAKALSAGTYDAAHVEPAQWKAALALFGPELGAGQVSAPGITSSTTQIAVEEHAEANNRVALIDLTDSGVVATLTAAVSSLRTATGARRSAAYTPWAKIPGLALEAPRTVPYSAVQAGIIARNDASATPPPVGEAPAGTAGRPRYAIGLTQEWTRAQREELNNGSVNVARTLPSGVIETYGNRTLVKPELEPAWQEISAVRLYMYVLSAGEAELEGATFKNIDNRNILYSNVEGRLTGMLKNLGTMVEFYAVSTGPTVNTPAVRKAKEVRADVEVKAPQVAETVTLNLSVAA